MNRFKTLYVIGEGSFGIVFLAQENSSGQLVAIKKMKRKYNSWEECMNLREVRSLRKIRHKNIIKLREVFREDNQLHLVFDYLESNLFKYYCNRFKDKAHSIPEAFIKKTIFQTLQGIAHLHEKGFFHRDLKPENLLINNDESVQIADFGLAREIRSMPPYTDYISTRWYRAPEMLLKMPNYSHPVDIFAIGCIMAELYLQKPLFDGKSELDQLHKIFNILGEPGVGWKEGVNLADNLGIRLTGKKAKPLEFIIPNASSSGIDLLTKMFMLDPMKRGSAVALIQHPYFDSIRKESKSPLTIVTDPENSDVKFKGGSPLIGSSKKIHFQELIGIELNKFEGGGKSPRFHRKKKRSSPFRQGMMSPKQKETEEVTPSMEDFYTSQEDNSLIENKSMTDEIEKIINQHNKDFRKTPKHNFQKQPLAAKIYPTLGKFQTSKPSPFEECLGNPQTPKSFIPYMSDKFNLGSGLNLSSKPSLRPTQKNTQNKENLKNFESPSDDLLPTYMRLMGNANSQSDFKFHF
jgi:serine/threonine protein kinase